MTDTMGQDSEMLADSLHLASPAALAEHLSGGRYRRARHITLLSGVLTAAVAEQLATEPAERRTVAILVEMPPRHSKSETCSHWFPTWAIALAPELQVMLGSYALSFARDWGRKVRNEIREHFSELGVKVAQDSKAAYRWHTEEGGGMTCVGVGGDATGRGADILVLDDPVKNAEDAISPTIQKRNWEWWKSTFRTRLNPTGLRIIVVIGTRWDENDLIGKLRQAHAEGSAAEGYEDWTFISFPALAQGDDVLDRKEGDPLWPEVMNRQALDATRVSVGEHWWAALYQQRPTPLGGDLIKERWFNYWVPAGADFPAVVQDGRECRVVELPALDGVFQSWDCNFRDSVRAIEKGHQPDGVAGHVYGRASADLFLMDRFYGRVGLNETIEAVRELSRRNPSAKTKLIENTANGPAVMAKLQHELGSMVPVTPHGSKVSRVMTAATTAGDRGARAITLQTGIQGGNVYLPHPGLKPWSIEVRQLLGRFPKGGKDDTDAMSQAWTYAQGPVWAEAEKAHHQALRDGPPPRNTKDALRQKIQKALAREKRPSVRSAVYRRR